MLRCSIQFSHTGKDDQTIFLTIHQIIEIDMFYKFVKSEDLNQSVLRLPPENVILVPMFPLFRGQIVVVTALALISHAKSGATREKKSNSF